MVAQSSAPTIASAVSRTIFCASFEIQYAMAAIEREPFLVSLIRLG